MAEQAEDNGGDRRGDPLAPLIDEAFALLDSLPKVARWTPHLEALRAAMRENGWELPDAIGDYEVALRAAIDRVGPEHPFAALLHRSLGTWLTSSYRLDEAIVELREALRLYGRWLQRGDELADCRNGLAMALSWNEQWAEAEEEYRRAAEEAAGDESRANALSGLAGVFAFSGDEARAKQARRAARRLVKAGHGGDASVLANVEVYWAARSAGELLEPFRELLEQARRAATSLERSAVRDLLHAALNKCADVYCNEGRWGRARAVGERVLDLLRRDALYGEGAGVELGALAACETACFKLGDVEAAAAYNERLCRAGKGVEIWSRARRARIEAARGQYDAAQRILREALEASEATLHRQGTALPDERVAALIADWHKLEDMIYTLAWHCTRARSAAAPQACELALATVLLRKGRAIDMAADISNAVLRGLGEGEKSQLAALRKLRNQIRLYDDLGARLPSQARKLEALCAEAERIERELARRSLPLREARRRWTGGEVVEAIRRRLAEEREDAALVELVEFDAWSFDPARAGRARRCFALVLRRDGALSLVDDFDDAGVIRDLWSRCNEVFCGRNPGWEEVARALHDVVAAPLLKAAGGAERLWLSTDGNFHTLPLAAALDAQGRHLGDTHRLTWLTSGRDLLREAVAPGAEAVILADPDFDAGPDGSAGGPSPTPAEQEGWSRVEEAAREARAIARILKAAGMPVRELYRREATEAALNAVHGPCLLHVVTHGEAPAGRTRHPLRRALLALAGANRASDGSGGEEPDGVVSASELATLDLWGTELVVLSACETGLGEETRGAGVLGLRRSLVVAGAETAVVSLWRANDDTAPELMARYYRLLVEEGERRDEALRQAMREVRRRHPHPHDWAAFIVIGRGEALRSVPRGGVNRSTPG